MKWSAFKTVCKARSMFTPNYVALFASGELERRAEQAVASLAECRTCPRACKADGLEETRQIVRLLSGKISPHTYVNLMAQYHPAGEVNAESYPELNRRIAAREMAAAYRLAREAGLHRFDQRDAL